LAIILMSTTGPSAAKESALRPKSSRCHESARVSPSRAFVQAWLDVLARLAV